MFDVKIFSIITPKFQKFHFIVCFDAQETFMIIIINVENS